MKSLRRRLGTVLIVLGVLGLAYGATIYFWHDPVTDLYARYKQHELDDRLADRFTEYRASHGLPTAPSSTAHADEESPVADAPAAEEPVPAPSEAELEQIASAFYADLELGEPLGRLVIPKLGIDPVFVNGTRWGADLSRGPGRYPETFLPGMGQLTAIAGHRTTFGAPFRHIDRLKAGDEIVLELAYGTFRYRVVEHEIVENDDWSIIDPRAYDTLVLSACHPLYSASKRWVVYSRLEKVEFPDGASLGLSDEAAIAAPTP